MSDRKTLVLIEYENGFVNVVKRAIPQDEGAYLLEEIPLMIRDEDHDKIDVIIFKYDRTTTLSKISKEKEEQKDGQYELGDNEDLSWMKGDKDE